MKRRRFLAATASAPALITGSCTRSQTLPGSIVGAASAHGHRLRQTAAFPKPARTLKTDVVVAGGGIAGLSAARRLRQLGVEKITVLDLESQPGGNSISGRNAVSAYPWGAHYVPLPGKDCHEVLQFFQETGLITGHDAAGRPVYDEFSLCHDPHERLFIHGQWEEGLLPLTGLTPSEKSQFDEFQAAMHRWQERHAFTLPVDRSPRDPEVLALDQFTMAAWMTTQGFTCEALRWHVDYCCRDDFGGGLDEVSAWAGIHYFASRSGEAANAGSDTVLTWPEGNARLVEKLGVEVGTNQLVTAITPAHVDALNTRTGEITRHQCRAIVCALPRFIAQRLIPGMAPLPSMQYAPWVVANLTLDELPPSAGVLPAWDNVVYRGPTLGYVNATHQNLDSVPHATVITHYEALCGQPPARQREWMLTQTHAQWTQRVLTALSAPHPTLVKHVRQLDVWLWGHGMIRPAPGFIWGTDRALMQQHQPPIFHAHSDMSGMSLFEEAYTRGVHAAQALHSWFG